MKNKLPKDHLGDVIAHGLNVLDGEQVNGTISMENLIHLFPEFNRDNLTHEEYDNMLERATERWKITLQFWRDNGYVVVQ